MEYRYIVCKTEPILEPFRSKFLYRYTIGYKTEKSTFKSVQDAFDYILTRVAKPVNRVKSRVEFTDLLQYSIYDMITGLELLSARNDTYRTPNKEDNIGRFQDVVLRKPGDGDKKLRLDEKNVHRILNTKVTPLYNMTPVPLLRESFYRKYYRTNISLVNTSTQTILMKEYKKLMDKYSVNHVNEIKKSSSQYLLDALTKLNDEVFSETATNKLTSIQIYEASYGIQTYRAFESTGGLYILKQLETMFYGFDLPPSLTICTPKIKSEPISCEEIVEIYNTKINNYNENNVCKFYRPQHSGKKSFIAITKDPELRDFIPSRDKVHYTGTKKRYRHHQNSSEIYKKNRSWKEKYKHKYQWGHNIPTNNYSEVVQMSPETQEKRVVSVNVEDISINEAM